MKIYLQTVLNNHLEQEHLKLTIKHIKNGLIKIANMQETCIIIQEDYTINIKILTSKIYLNQPAKTTKVG